jgi:hypothetical protein
VNDDTQKVVSNRFNGFALRFREHGSQEKTVETVRTVFWLTSPG